eukprot:756607-Hanusia_phi.AAC.2
MKKHGPGLPLVPLGVAPLEGRGLKGWSLGRATGDMDTITGWGGGWIAWVGGYRPHGGLMSGQN